MTRRPTDATDADLLDDLRTEMGIEPSPSFDARVRQRIANEPAVRNGWVWAAGLVGAGLLALAIVSLPTRIDETRAPDAPARAAAAAPAAAPAVDGSTTAARVVDAPVRAAVPVLPAAAPRVAAFDPFRDVIIAPGDRLGVRPLVRELERAAAVGDDHVARELARVLALDHDDEVRVVALNEPVPIDVAPIGVRPIGDAFAGMPR